MVTSNIYQRTFNLRYGNSTGTIFTIDVNNRQYLVTAKHCVANLADGGLIEILLASGWTRFNVTIIGHHPTADISVLCIPTPIPALPTETEGNFTISEDVYFLGFPFGISYDVGALNRNIPMPIVKKAIISGVISNNNLPSILLLDGMNNPGFSGGPVVNKIGNTCKILSVISGYRYEEHLANIPNTAEAITYRTNSGIIISYDIRQANALIRDNPVGTILR